MYLIEQSIQEMRNIIDSKIKSVEEQLLYSDNQLINWE